MKCADCKAVNQEVETFKHHNPTNQIIHKVLQRKARELRKMKDLNHFCEFHMQGGLAKYTSEESQKFKFGIAKRQATRMNESGASLREIVTSLTSKILLVMLISGTLFAQTVNPPSPRIVGHSFVAMAPWQSIGIPLSWVKGFNGATCAYLSPILPALVPLHTPVVALVEGTNEIERGIPASVTVSCIGQQLAWLQLNRPGIKIVLANVAPFSLGNCYGDYRSAIAAYNSAYQSLAASYGIRLVDISTAITMPNGWALEPYISGACLIHPGQPGIPNLGWYFFMGQIVTAMN